jgi:hypothetical protein
MAGNRTASLGLQRRKEKDSHEGKRDLRFLIDQTGKEEHLKHAS